MLGFVAYLYSFLLIIIIIIIPVPFVFVHYNNDARFNRLNAEINPTCHLLALLEARHILHVSRIGVNESIVFCVCPVYDMELY
jgi:hypothetical protein